MSLTIENLDVFHGEQQTLFEVSLHVEDGEFFSVLGNSGCGKSTLLKAVAGLIATQAGAILLDGEPLDGLPPEARPVSLVCRDLRLFPHLTVLENICFPLKMADVPEKKRLSQAADALGAVYGKALGTKRPAALSVEERERAALAQALVMHPRILLLDEPFSMLETESRAGMRKLIRELHERFELTVIQVTADRDDALMLSDHMAFMMEGEIMQCDTPDQVYNFPGTLDIAEYFCNGNTLPGTVQNGRFESGTIRLSAPGLPDGPCMAMIRPGIISVALDPGDFAVEHVEYLGDYQRLYVRRNDCTLNFVTDLSGRYRTGDMIDLRIQDGKALFYR
ncbi:MAG: ABC transporter ATP-binding protein [Clostridiales Family XIII bacterium]|jgi:ABC-type Fe3+/spermidine/putrescine transport system ATPase subunit|nr:ABC transporter ATP-binding protein [Clostridiales Family XIII bacterium]